MSLTKPKHPRHKPAPKVPEGVQDVLARVQREIKEGR